MDREIALEPNWILWPDTPAGPNRDLVRLLSLTTGADWNLPATDFRVREAPASGERGGLALVDADALARRGLFSAREALFRGRRLVPFARPGGAVPLEAIALCANGAAPVVPATGADARDPTALLVAVAPDGDAVVRARRAVTGSEVWNTIPNPDGSPAPNSALAPSLAPPDPSPASSRASSAGTEGRILLIEYPPPAGSRWSRFWLLGAGWPAVRGSAGSPLVISPVTGGVGGLVPAREAARLLLRPTTFRWTPADGLVRREADRWLGPASSPVPILLVVLAGLAAAGWGLSEVARDRRDARADLAARAAFALPGAVLASPLLSSGFGPGFWPLSTALLLAGALGLATGFRRWWGASAELALLGALGTLAAGFAGPLHPWSGVLRDLPGAVSPERLGAMALYPAVAGAATRRGEGLLWFAVRLASVAAVAATVWVRPEIAFAPLLGLLAGQGVVGLATLPAAATLPAGLLRLRVGGLDWRPNGLVREWPPSPDVNLWWSPATLLSPPALLALFAVAFGGMTLAPYTIFRLRRTLQAPPSDLTGVERGGPGAAGLWAAAGLFAASLLTPEWMPGGLVAGVAALPLLLSSARATS